MRRWLAGLLILGLVGLATPSAGQETWPMLRFGGTPTISGCGTGATVSGFDSGGTITLGTGAITACKLIFSKTYSPRLRCPSVSVNGVAVAVNVVPTTTDLTFTAILTGGVSVDWFCSTP